MITGFVTFITIFAVVGAILYGRRLVKTEKSDAVLAILKEQKEEYIGLLLDPAFSCCHGFIIHGILLNLFIQNQQMNFVKLLK